MNTSRWLGCGALALLLILPAQLRADDTPVPDDAKKLIDDFDREAKDIQEKAEKEVKARRDKLIEKLKQLQDTYTRAGKLDEAVAISEKIKVVKIGTLEIKPDPGTVNGLRDQVGKSFVYEVTGKTDGVIWGSGLYTDDSQIATAAVHCGALKAGQKGLVRVTILKGEASYLGSTSNGVTSNPYGEWGGSYRIDPIE
jgi:hypothetical protein